MSSYAAEYSSFPAPPSASAAARRRKEIYSYDAPWSVYGLASSQRPGAEFRFALGSFMEEYSNKVQVSGKPWCGCRR